MSIPNWYGLLLLVGGAFRLWVLLAEDTILDAPRGWLTGLSERLETMITCPWCLGAWLSIGFWGLWEIWPTPMLIAMTPLTISAAVGLLGRLS